MNDGCDALVQHHLLDKRAIAGIAFDLGDRPTRDIGDNIKRTERRIDVVVDHDNVVSSLEQRKCRMAADVTGATAYENGFTHHQCPNCRRTVVSTAPPFLSALRRLD